MRIAARVRADHTRPAQFHGRGLLGEKGKREKRKERGALKKRKAKESKGQGRVVVGTLPFIWAMM